MLDPQDALGIERATVGAYEWAELVLITMIAESLATVAETPTWASEQLLELQRLKRRTAQVTAELQRDTPALLEDAVEQAYTKGRIMAEAELITHRRAGHSVPGVVEEPAAEIAGPSRRILPKPTPVAKPTHANRAILNITRAGVNALHPIHGQIGRRTDDIWRRIINEASGSVATGDASPKKAIQEAFTRMTRKGLGFYEDSAGRKWGLDTYAEMAVRTTANNALLAGHTDALQAAGADLVVVSSHKNPAPQCAPFERKVLSLSGKYGPGSHVVDGETVHVKATMRQAEASGLHHPNAILGGSQEIDTFAGAVGASKGTYRGPAITIRTAQGNSTTVSPEHPVLTSRGWRTAESLSEGDYVLNPISAQGCVASIPGESDIDDVPTTVEDEFVALKHVGSSQLVASAGNNFDDDRQFINGEIDVVVTNDCLLPVPDVHVIKETGEVSFVRSDMGGFSEIGDGSQPLRAGSVSTSLSVAGPLSNVDSVGLQSPTNGCVGGVEDRRDLLACHSALVHGDDLCNVQLRPGPQLVSEFSELMSNGRVGDSQDIGTVALATPFGIELDEVVSVERVEFSGQAYDFQTTSGVYAVNSILLHNCRHTHSLFIPGVTSTSAPPVDDDHVGYRATQRQRYLERQIRASRRMEAAAMDDDARRRAVSRRRAYEAKLREHVGEWDLPRRRDRETLR